MIRSFWASSTRLSSATCRNPEGGPLLTSWPSLTATSTVFVVILSLLMNRQTFAQTLHFLVKVLLCSMEGFSTMATVSMTATAPSLTTSWLSGSSLYAHLQLLQLAQLLGASVPMGSFMGKLMGAL